jgi:lysophospholipase L1-like esterase
MWVNICLPATPERQEGWNAALDTVAAERSDEMFVCDWASLATQNPQWLSVDLVHCTGAGYKQRAKAIAKATRTVVPSAPIITGALRTRRQGATNVTS